MAAVTTLTATEVAALTGVDEKRVRKEVEHGVFRPGSPPRFDLADAVYLRALSLLGVQLGVEDRAKLHGIIAEAMAASDPPPSKVSLGPVLEMTLAPLADALRDRVDRFEAWKQTRVTIAENVLGGEPVFTKSRLAVRHVGGLLLRGAQRQVQEDYPYLQDEDLEFAPVFARAYPPMGRPRECQAAGR